MKKIITIVILLLSFISNAQIEKGEVKPREEILSAPMLICSTEERDKWFAILPTFKKFDGILVKTYFTTLKLHIGECSKNDVLVFTFTDGKKLEFLQIMKRIVMEYQKLTFH